MTNLTASEVKILSILQENHLTNVELADRLGMAASPCLRRVKMLKESGIIDRTVTIVNRRMVGFKILAHVEVKVPQLSDRAVDIEFREAVVREPSIVGCFVIAGQFDFLLKVVSPSIEDFSVLQRTVLLRLPGVQDMRSSFVLEVVKDTTALPLNALSQSS